MRWCFCPKSSHSHAIVSPPTYQHWKLTFFGGNLVKSRTKVGSIWHLPKPTISCHSHRLGVQWWYRWPAQSLVFHRTLLIVTFVQLVVEKVARGLCTTSSFITTWSYNKMMIVVGERKMKRWSPRSPWKEEEGGESYISRYSFPGRDSADSKRRYAEEI